MNMQELTKKERNAITTLERLKNRWPDTLWIFATGNSLSIMRKNDEGEHAATSSGGMDPDYIVASIDIENDGGDW